MATVSKRKWTHKGISSTAWVVRYKDPSGARRSKQFDLKKEADRFRQKVEEELVHGCHTTAANASTIGETCEVYLRHAEGKLHDKRIGTARYKTLANSVGKCIPARLGRLRFVDLTAPMVEDFYARVVREDGLHPRTVKQRVIDLGLVEEFAYKRGITAKRVVPDTLKELRGIRSDKVRTFTSDEMLRLLKACEVKRSGGWNRVWFLRLCFVNIATFTGLRFGEIRGLTLDNVDIDRRLLKVRHNLTEWDELKAPKTPSGRRDVPMPEHVARLIAEWSVRYHTPNDRGLIFRTIENNAISASSFHTHAWRPLLEDAGLMDDGPVFHFHALRHFCASWMIENRLPVTEVAVLMGHSKFDTTLQTYAHPVVSEARRHDAIDRMTEALIGTHPPVPTARVTQRLLTV